MGLRLEIDSDIKSAFDTDLADAVKGFTGISTTTAQSDDDWLINNSTKSTISYQGRGVFGSFSQNEIDGQTILQNDVKLICLQSEVTATPAIDDTINGYQVVAVNKDPAGVTYVCQLRKI